MLVLREHSLSRVSQGTFKQGRGWRRRRREGDDREVGTRAEKGRGGEGDWRC